MAIITDGEKKLKNNKQKLVYMINIEELDHSDVEHKEEVIALSKEATRYLNSFSWCEKIVSGALAEGFGYIICIFLFEIEPSENSGADESLWIIVGDLPYAYLDTIQYKTTHEALDFYCFLMNEWIDHVRMGKSLEACYPVNVEPTLEHANMLDTRIKLIESEFLPKI